MRLAIFGATGGTGKAVTSAALAAGHDVTVVVRNPARLEVPADAVRVVRPRPVRAPTGRGGWRLRGTGPEQ